MEVKRVRKGSGARILAEDTPKIEAPSREPWPVPSFTPAAVPAQPQSAPPRRILEAIEPPPAAVDAAETIVPNTTVRRGRGRPRKSVNGTDEGEAARVSRIEPKVRQRPEQRRVAAPVEAPVIFAVPRSAPAPKPRMNHDSRAAEADSLPRGERWKRRLPKVLW